MFIKLTLDIDILILGTENFYTTRSLQGENQFSC